MANSTAPPATAAAAAAPVPVVTESRSESLVGIVSCMMVLATVVLLLRVWTRARVQGTSSGADEWAILVSWLSSVAFTINVCVREFVPYDPAQRGIPSPHPFSFG